MSLCKASVAHASVMAYMHQLCFDDGWNEKAFYDLLALPTTIGWIDENSFILCSHVLDEMEILTICTIPEKRRMGYGKTLLNTLDDYAKKHMIKRIFLEVRSNNLPAKSLYETNGFNQTGIRKGYYKTADGMIDAVCMTKVIG